jgi:serine protease Do
VSEEGINYTVRTASGDEYPLTILAQDPASDIAVVKIKATSLPYLSFADSGKVRLGETVIAIGNALGEFNNTVSVGVISGVGRSIAAKGVNGEVEQFDELIQTDAAINPGNSGGPLLNSIGQVVGVNVAVAEGSQSVGFSIPSNSVKNTLRSFQP